VLETCSLLHENRGVVGVVSGPRGNLHHGPSNITGGYNALLLAFLFMRKEREGLADLLLFLVGYVMLFGKL
jgi:hypothetical protein